MACGIFTYTAGSSLSGPGPAGADGVHSALRKPIVLLTYDSKLWTSTVEEISSAF